MKLLITGGAGFMGSNFIRHILEKYPDYRVRNLDKLTYAGNLENLADVVEHFGDRYEFVKGDIADARTVNENARDVDAIINYAAETHVDRSIHGARDFIMTDVLGTHNLLEATKNFSIPRFVQISTDEVYGTTDDGEFFEHSSFQPNSPYAASKAGGDLMCRAYHVTHKTPVIVTHSCNFYGPNQYPEKIIPLFITNLLEGKKVPLYGVGAQVREWIYTEDHCRAIDTILHKGVVGEVYNIGTTESYPNIETTKLTLRLMGKDESHIQLVPDRPGHDFRYSVNCDKLMQDLDWKPEHSFEQGLEKTIRWYTENDAWWRKIKSGEYLDWYKKQYSTMVTM